MFRALQKLERVLKSDVVFLMNGDADVKQRESGVFQGLAEREAECALRGGQQDRRRYDRPRRDLSRPYRQGDAGIGKKFHLRIRDRERKLISKIKEALDRLDQGTFGICEECGEDISEERLKARPVTTLCINCKKRQENEERLKGI
jgi:DnaK suppressor protein